MAAWALVAQEIAASWYDLSRRCERTMQGSRSENLASMPGEAALHPWRRLLRFSVRGLIFLVLVIGAGLGWIVRSARIQRDAVAAIERAGGEVTYDWEWQYTTSMPAGKPRAPRWLVKLLGVDLFGHITNVYGLTATDTSISQVGSLSELERLSLDRSPIGDSGVARLQGLTKLRSLELGGTRITDAGLKHLKGLTALNYLGLNSTPITDRGLVHLKGLSDLAYLHIDGTQITDAGLAHLKGLTKLRFIGLGKTQVTDAGMEDLKRALPCLTIDR
jgi:internalin A